MTPVTAPWRSPLAALLLASAGLLGAGCTDPVKAECTGDAECPDNQVCVEGACQVAAECVIDLDCGPGGICVAGACETRLPVGDGDGDPEPDPTGDDRVLQLDPEGALDFGSPVLGVGIERTVSVLNAGDAPFSVTGATLSDETSDEMVVTTDPALPVSLDPGDRVEIKITYTLADGEDDQGLLRIATTAEACTPACDDPTLVEVPLVSEFKGGRELALTPPEHDFGYSPVGQVSTVRSLLLSNQGTLDKVLTIDDIAVVGDVDQFQMALPALPVYLAPGESVEVPVAYEPDAAANEHSVTFTVSANSDSPPNRVLTSTFRGTSQPPQALVWTPPELVFPNVAIGTSSQLQSQLQNVGGMPVQVTNLLFGPNNAEYSFVAFDGGAQVTFPRTVFPGDALDVYVEYVAASGQATLTTLMAANDQPSGDVPVLQIRGESFVPPGGPVLHIVSSPVTQIDSDCGCQATGNVPAANIDLTYRAQAGGATCGKPANPACGLGGTNCTCGTMNSYGSVKWGGARVEEVRGEQWIIDEAIHHEGTGTDGTFLVRTDLLDDCLAVPGSTDYAVNHACCMWVDCESGTQACFDYTSDYPLCANECQYQASVATSQDCLLRGAITVRTVVTVSQANGTVVEERHFCQTHGQSGAGGDVVSVTRQAGYFQVGGKAAGVTEVSPGQACP